MSLADIAKQPGRLRFALLTVCLGSLLGPLDTSVNVAFPMITKAFGLAISDIQWIVISYIVAQTGLTLAFGQLGDLFGHRRIFRLGMAACAVTHLLCALAPTYPLLLAARVAQGVAVGLAMACGPAIATLLFPPQMRRAILSVYVMLLGAGVAIGPLMGGLMLDWGGWPTVFWFRTPLSLVVLLLTFWLPDPPIERREAPRFDYIGAVLLTAILGSLILLITMARRPDASIWPIVGFALLFVGSVWAFVAHESRFVQPILHVRHLRNPAFSGLQLVAITQNFCGFSVFLLLPYVLDAELKLDSLGIGLALAIAPLGNVTAALTGGRYAGHWSARRLMTTGLAMCSAGLALVGLMMASQSVVAIGMGLFLNGLGIGLFQIGYMDQTTATLPPAERGVAGSLLNVTRVVGAVIGAALITWMLEGWRAIVPGLDAFRLSFGSLGVLLAGVTVAVGLGVVAPRRAGS